MTIEESAHTRAVRKWRGEHPEKVREMLRTWRKNNAAKTKAQARKDYSKWYATHKQRAIERASQYQRSHPEESRKRNQKYRQRHVDQVREIQKRYEEKYTNKIRKSKSKYVKDHPEAVKTSLGKYQASHPNRGKLYYNSHREEIKERYNNKMVDPHYKMSSVLRNRISKIFRLTNYNKCAKTTILIGCSIEEFIQHISSQFRDGMTLANHGTVWHIDHVRPIVSFDLSDPEQQKECFNYKNLQPLLARENMNKRNFWNGKFIRRSTKRLE